MHLMFNFARLRTPRRGAIGAGRSGLVVNFKVSRKVSTTAGALRPRRARCRLKSEFRLKPVRISVGTPPSLRRWVGCVDVATYVGAGCDAGCDMDNNLCPRHLPLWNAKWSA